MRFTDEGVVREQAALAAQDVIVAGDPGELGLGLGLGLGLAWVSDASLMSG